MSSFVLSLRAHSFFSGGWIVANSILWPSGLPSLTFKWTQILAATILGASAIGHLVCV